MAMHNTNSLLKFVAIPTIVLVVIVILISWVNNSSKVVSPKTVIKEKGIKDSAAHDSAAESLDTLTAELALTKQKVAEVSKDSHDLKKQNTELLNQVNNKQNQDSSALSAELDKLKNQIQQLSQSSANDYKINNASASQSIGVVDDLAQPTNTNGVLSILNSKVNTSNIQSNNVDEHQLKVIPYYTIPANGTSVRDKLMTALVGRIPVKGVVTDPYPFKIVVSDDNLAANGLRIPNLVQMIVSGYCEGDLNLVSVRGWVTSLTFVFADGTISTTSSNENDAGGFNKSNTLGFLSDSLGNPYVIGVKFLSNSITYLGGGVALGMATAGATAFSQSQTTNTSSFLGNSNSVVTGSTGKYLLGQAASGGASAAQQWWKDREEESFDAVYVPPVDEKGNFIEVVVNFTKEIHIDYDPKGRKLSYAHTYAENVTRDLD